MRPGPSLALCLALAGALAVCAVPGAAQDAPAVVIAVVDGGVDGEHRELAGRVEYASFVAGALPEGPLPLPLPLPADADGHGTAAASLAAGATLGQAPAARVLDLRMRLSQDVGAPLSRSEEEAATAALDFLLRMQPRPQVVLLSFADMGVSQSGAATLAAQAEALSETSLVIVPSPPAADALSGNAHVLTVSCEEGCLQGGQSGAGVPLKPDVVAPGASLAAAAPSTLANRDARATVTGTAFAAASVAGQAARLLQERPGLPPQAAAAILRGTAVDLGVAGPDPASGHGRTDLAAALAAAREWEAPLASPAGRESPTLPATAFLVVGGMGALAARRRGLRGL